MKIKNDNVLYQARVLAEVTKASPSDTPTTLELGEIETGIPFPVRNKDSRGQKLIAKLKMLELNQSFTIPKGFYSTAGNARTAANLAATKIREEEARPFYVKTAALPDGRVRVWRVEG